MNKILVRGADTVGSFVLATPFYRELRKNFVDAYIVLCVKPLVYELAKNCPYVNKVLIYDRNKFFNIKNFKKEKFDTVFLLSGSFESALVSFLAGIKNRIGYPHDHRGFLLTKKVVEKERRHYVDYILHILEYQNLKVEDRKTEIYVNDVETKYDYIFNKKSKIIGLNLTAVGEEARNWPKEYAVELTKRLLEKNFIVTLFGVKNDLEYGNYLESRIKNNNFVNLIGKTNLVEFVNLVKKCDLYLSVATGGIHIASALGVKVIGLYCPGDDFSWGPVRNNSMVITKSVNCKPCNQHKMKYCKDNKCMKQISVDEVYEKILSFVD